MVSWFGFQPVINLPDDAANAGVVMHWGRRVKPLWYGLGGGKLREAICSCLGVMTHLLTSPR